MSANRPSSSGGNDVEQTGFFDGQGGPSLFYRFEHDADDRAALLIAHGLGEHSGRYRNLVEAVRPRKISVFAVDHRGFGQSGGSRGCVERFGQYVDGVKTLAEFAASKMGGKKLFLLGHSMGGLIAIHYALRFPETIAGVIPSSAALQVSVPIPRIKGALGRFMSGIAPGLTLDNELVPDHLCRDPEVVRDYVNDPLVHRRISTRLFTELMTGMDFAHARAAQLRMPLLIFHGTGDKITHPDGSKRFFEAAGSADKTLKFYEGFYHETMNDPGHEQVTKTVADWIDARI